MTYGVESATRGCRATEGNMDVLRLVRGGSRQDQRGAALVEFALVLPILLILVFGIIDFGFLFNAQVSLTQATREGVRAGAIGTAPSIGDMEQRMQQAYFGFAGDGQPEAVGGSAACGSNPSPSDTARLQSQLEFTTPIGRFQPTLRAEAVMRCGG